jgi:regulator of ribosome biosynthesis
MMNVLQIPKEKPLTRWEKYAKLKGIKKQKKERMVWDEEAQEFRPRWGYKRANSIKDQWLVEAKPGDGTFL